jgi:hypothetical protein
VQPPTSTLNGGTIVDNSITTYNSAITQQTPWGGGAFSFQFNNNKQVTSNNLVNYNPAYNSNFACTLRAAVCCAASRSTTTGSSCASPRLNRDASEIQLRGTIASTLANVRNAYWEYVYALQALEVTQGRSISPRSSSGQPQRASRSGRSRRSTSCRPRPKSPTGTVRGPGDAHGGPPSSP